MISVRLLNAVLFVVTPTELMERSVMMVLPSLDVCLIVLIINQALYVQEDLLFKMICVTQCVEMGLLQVLRTVMMGRMMI